MLGISSRISCCFREKKLIQDSKDYNMWNINICSETFIINILFLNRPIPWGNYLFNDKLIRCSETFNDNFLYFWATIFHYDMFFYLYIIILYVFQHLNHLCPPLCFRNKVVIKLYMPLYGLYNSISVWSYRNTKYRVMPLYLV